MVGTGSKNYEVNPEIENVRDEQKVSNKRRVIAVLKLEENTLLLGKPGLKRQVNDIIGEYMY